MKYKIVYLRRALQDLVEIREYLGQFSDDAPLRILGRIKQRIENLAEHPRISPFYDDLEIRKLVVGDYLVLYQINENKKSIEILYILHGTRNIAAILRSEPVDK